MEFAAFERRVGVNRLAQGPGHLPGTRGSKGDVATASVRIGIGHDTHRLVRGGPLKLGGVEIPHNKHLDGHSDADVLLHAVTDALLGAAALGDIGEMFPNTDRANRGRDSSEMLTLAAERVYAAGYRVGNLDCVVLAEKPKLLAFREVIRRRIAEILQIDAEQIGLKAKTGEKVGFVGREEAIVAECVVLLEETGWDEPDTVDPPAAE